MQSPRYYEPENGNCAACPDDWCMGMQLISGEKFARFPVSRNTEKGKRREYKTFTTASGPQPVVETFLSHSDIPRGLKFQDFLIHKGNGCVVWPLPAPVLP